MAKWSKNFSREAAREIASQVIWSYWPYWGAPVVSAILAYSGGYSATIIFMVALGAFAMIAMGLNNFSQWMSAESPAGKVDFLVPSIGVKNDDSVPPQLEGVKLGVVLRSTAPFPLEIRIDELETQISDRIPTEAFHVRSITVTRGVAAQFSNAMISLTGIERANQLIYGKITASVSYGRPGNLKYPLERVWFMAFKFDQNGNLQNAEPSTTEFKKGNGG